MQVHQVLVGASSGDAITNEALGLRDAIRNRFRGVVSEVFSHHRQESLTSILPLAEYDRRAGPDWRDRLLIFHSSIGEPAIAGFLGSRRERLVVRYHNITPSSFFRPYNPTFADLLDLGREQLVSLRDRTTLAIADSRFNEAELHEAGFRNTKVVPVYADLRGLRSAVPVPPRRFPLARHDGEPVVIFVGRVAPNKGHVRLLQAHHVLKTYRQFDSHLWIVGGPSLPEYSWRLEQYRRELGLIDLQFTGTVSQQELAYIYRRADVLLCLSQHEGFCVPLIEAMACDVPIVALDRTAVAETLGGAGLLIRDDGPEVVAEAVSAVIDDEELRKVLVARGRRRLQDLAPERSADAFVRALEPVIAS